MPDLIPDPGLTFDEALVMDAALKLCGDLDHRFRHDAILDQARQKLWGSTLSLHRADPQVYERSCERLLMRQRLGS